jgi:hypothetical protein
VYGTFRLIEIPYITVLVSFSTLDLLNEGKMSSENVVCIGRAGGRVRGDTEYTDSRSVAVEIAALFKDTVKPGVYLNKSNRIVIPDNISVQMGKSSAILCLFRNPDEFSLKPVQFRKAVLDVLYIMLRRSPYNVIRFQNFTDMYDDETGEPISLVRLFLNALNRISDGHENYAVSKRIIRLLGIMGPGGIKATDMREILDQLQPLSDLNICWLQALKVMMKHEHSMTKASPPSFFNFGGQGSGIFSVLKPFPFQKEYQLFTWFRLESFQADSGPSQYPTATQGPSIASITCGDCAVSVLVENRKVVVSISYGRSGSDTSRIVLDYPDGGSGLRRGVWYHISLRHRQAGYSTFFGGNDELVVHMDQKQAFSGTIKFPVVSRKILTEFSVGRNFDGQIGPIYFLSESSHPNTVAAIAQVDGGKIKAADNGGNAFQSDMRSLQPSNGRFVTTYHPNRTAYGHSIDIQGGRHARIGPLVFATQLASVRNTLDSLGGIMSLFPIFPNILIEPEEEDEDERTYGLNMRGVTFEPSQVQAKSMTQSVDLEGTAAELKKRRKSLTIVAPLESAVGKGYSAATIRKYHYTLRDLVQDSLDDDIVESNTLSAVAGSEIDAKEENYLSLLIAIISRCLEDSAYHQYEFLRCGGVEMLEYMLLYNAEVAAFNIVPSCISEIRQMRNLVKGYPTLEASVTKNILFNFAIWCRTDFELQSAVVAVLNDDIKRGSERDNVNSCVLNVSELLFVMEKYFMDSELGPRFERHQPVDSMRSQASQLSHGDNVALLKSHSRVDSAELISPAATGHASGVSSVSAADNEDIDVSILMNDDGPSLGMSCDVPSVLSCLTAQPFNTLPPDEIIAPAPLSVQTSRFHESENIVFSPPIVSISSLQFCCIPGLVTSQDPSSPVSQLPLLSPLGRTVRVLSPGRDKQGTVVHIDPHETLRSSAPSTGRGKSRFKSAVAQVVRQRSAVDLLSLTSNPSIDENSKDLSELGCGVVQDYSLDSFGNPGGALEQAAAVHSDASVDVIGSHNPLETLDVGEGFIERGHDSSSDSTTIFAATPVISVLIPPAKLGFRNRSGSVGESFHDYEPLQAMESLSVSQHIPADPYSLNDVQLYSHPNSGGSVRRNFGVRARLNRAQRGHLRNEIWSIVMIMILSFEAGDKQIQSLLGFMTFCRDTTVLFEISQLVLSLLVIGGQRILSAITETFVGAEEFASCVMLKLVNNPSEDIRYTGIRLLTHYYLRIPTLSAGLQSLSSINSTAKAQILTQYMNNKYQQRNEFFRLHLFGGVWLLHQILDSFLDISSARTYSGLVEMLLLHPDECSRVDMCAAIKARSNMVGEGFIDFNPLTSKSNQSALSSTKPNTRAFDFASPGIIRNDAPLLFVDYFISPNMRANEDEDQNMTNAEILPLLLLLLPKFSSVTQQQILPDMLSLLKRSAGNRSAFCRLPMWHISLFTTVLQLFGMSTQGERMPSKPVTSNNMLMDLEDWILLTHLSDVGDNNSLDEQIILRRICERRVLNPVKASSLSRDLIDTEIEKIIRTVTGSVKPIDAADLRPPYTEPVGTGAGEWKTLLTVDVPPGLDDHGNKDPSASKGPWFSFALKVYCTLLMHEMRRKDGWISVISSVSQGKVCHQRRSFSEDEVSSDRLDASPGEARYLDLSNRDDIPFCSKVILSHVITEITADVRKTYAELRSKKNVDRMHNIFNLLMFAAEFAHSGKASSTRTIIGMDEIHSRQRLHRKDAFEDGFVKSVRFEKTIIENPFSEKEHTDVNNDHLTYDTTDKMVGPVMNNFTSCWQSLPISSSMLAGSRLSNSVDRLLSDARLMSSLRYSEDIITALDEEFCSEEDSNLLILLQVQSLFDCIFWPDEDQPLRNTPWLKYSKPPPSKAEGVARALTSITLFVSMLRSSLVILCTLNPLSELAVTNIIRIRYLIAAGGSTLDVPRKQIRVNDWVTVVSVHIVLSLQRVIHSMSSLFDLLDMPVRPLTVPVAGRLAPEEIDQLYVDYETDLEILNVVGSDVIKMKTLDLLFSGVPGENLLRYIKSCTIALVQMLTSSWSRHILSEAFGSEFDALEQCIRRICVDGLSTSARRPDSQQWKDMSELNIQEDATFPRSSLEDCAEDVYVSEIRHHRRSRDSADSDGCSDEETPAELNFSLIAKFPSSLSSPQQSPRQISGVDHEGVPSVDAVTVSSYTTPASALESPQKDSPRPEDPVFDFNFSPPKQLGARFTAARAAPTTTNLHQKTGGTVAGASFESFASGDDIMGWDYITVLRILRNPYFRYSNLSICESAVISLMRVEEEEEQCLSALDTDMRSYCKMLAEHVNPVAQMSKEGYAFRDLSTSTLATIALRERGRTGTLKQLEDLHTKQAANYWIQCNYAFDTILSPYQPASDLTNVCELGSGEVLDASVNTNRCTFEYSRAFDTRFQRQILTRCAEIIDHSEESYLGNKTTELSQSSQANDLHLTHSGRGDKKLTWLKNSMVASSANVWEDDDSLLSLPPSNKETRAAANGGIGTASDNYTQGNSNGLWNAGTEFLGGYIGAAFSSEHMQQRPTWSSAFEWKPDEKMLLHVEASLLRVDTGAINGELVLTTRGVYYYSRDQKLLTTSAQFQQLVDHCTLHWDLDWVEEMYCRRHLQKVRSIELYLVDASSILMVFASTLILRRFYLHLKQYAKHLRMPLLSSTPNFVRPDVLMQLLPWTDRWCKRMISNYEYLMRLNIISGRSFNDLCQYPIFPWVLADYLSPTLDLTNPAAYRDLSKPMGALNEERFKYFLERFRDSALCLDDPNERFMYGSHYSTEAYVLHYLIRQEPFTTLGVKFQEGRFDCPDRLFIDIGKAWESSSSINHTDVKELVPEFFSCPEIFLNTNHLPLGELQDGNVTVDDVVLPPWAENSAHEFIRKHREALESEYVSQHLHEWIDLIFGFKQTGEEAVEAKNVFRAITYEGYVDIDTIADDNTRRAVEDEIMYYGQTPSRLFMRPHPKRRNRDSEGCALTPLCFEATVEALAGVCVFTPLKQSASGLKGSSPLSRTGKHSNSGPQHSEAARPVTGMYLCGDKLVVAHSNFTISTYRWAPFADSDINSPFQVRFERDRRLPLVSHGMSPEILAADSFIPMAPVKNSQPLTVEKTRKSYRSGSRRPINSRLSGRVCPSSNQGYTDVCDDVSVSKSSTTGARTPKRVSQIYSSDSIRAGLSWDQHEEISCDQICIESCSDIASDTITITDEGPRCTSANTDFTMESQDDVAESQFATILLSNTSAHGGVIAEVPIATNTDLPYLRRASDDEIDLLSKSNINTNFEQISSSAASTSVQSLSMSSSTDVSSSSGHAHFETAGFEARRALLVTAGSSSLSSSGTDMSPPNVKEQPALRRLSLFQKLQKGLGLGTTTITVDSIEATESNASDVLASSQIRKLSLGNDSGNTSAHSANSSGPFSGQGKQFLTPTGLPSQNVILDDHLFDSESALTTKLYDDALCNGLEAFTNMNICLCVSGETDHASAGQTKTQSSPHSHASNLAAVKIITCGYWDDSLRIHAADSLKELAVCTGTTHSSPITCVTSSRCTSAGGGASGGALVFLTGSRDCTVRVWVVDNARVASAFAHHTKGIHLKTIDSNINSHDSAPSVLMCAHVLRGHQSPVTAVAYSADLDLSVSTGLDGLVCLHSVSKGAFIRGLSDFIGQTVDVVYVCTAGYVVLYSSTLMRLCVYWVNGQILGHVVVSSRLVSVTLAVDCCHLCFGFTGSTVLLVMGGQQCWSMGTRSGC